MNFSTRSYIVGFARPKIHYGALHCSSVVTLHAVLTGTVWKETKSAICSFCGAFLFLSHFLRSFLSFSIICFRKLKAGMDLKSFNCRTKTDFIIIEDGYIVLNTYKVIQLWNVLYTTEIPI